MKWLLLLLFLSGCSYDLKNDVNPEFDKYVAEFRSQGADRGWYYWPSGMIIKFTDLGAEAGHCHIDGNTRQRTITIDNYMWSVYNDELREWLIFHELGHCVLMKNHIGGVAYMNDGFSTYNRNYPEIRTKMIDELFSF